jgi:hypothetical protein
MPIARRALVVLGVVLYAPLVLVAGCGNFCGNPWDSPVGSIRHQLYDLLEQNRWLATAIFASYALAVMVVYRREIVAASSGAARVRVLVLLATALAIAGVSMLWRIG